jgi:hypothetical protein
MICLQVYKCTKTSYILPSEHSHEKSERIHEKIFALCYVASRPDNLTSLPFAHKMMG